MWWTLLVALVLAGETEGHPDHRGAWDVAGTPVVLADGVLHAGDRLVGADVLGLPAVAAGRVVWSQRRGCGTERVPHRGPPRFEGAWLAWDAPDGPHRVELPR